jgi:predicted lipoprotein
MKRPFAWLTAVVLLAALTWFFPLFHIMPLEQARQARTAGAFNPEQFAEKFWNDRLLKSLDRAVNADVLLPAIQSDPAAARKKFSRSLGISESYFYFVSGRGRVLGATNDEIALVATAGATQPEIVLPVGLLFGNAVRDGTGLLDVNDYPNSQDYNGISQALNHIIETRVLPLLRERGKAGATVRFVGCAEITDESTDLKPLRVVPIQAEILDAP